MTINPDHITQGEIRDLIEWINAHSAEGAATVQLDPLPLRPYGGIDFATLRAETAVHNASRLNAAAIDRRNEEWKPQEGGAQ